MTQREIIVIGAGMVGASTALELKLRGHAVTLIDRRDPGLETSYGNAGVIQAEAVEPYAFPRDWVTLFGAALGRRLGVRYQVTGLFSALPQLARYWWNSAPERHRRISHQGGVAERKTMIDRSHDLPVVRQCQILSLARSTAYYRPQEASETDLALMRRMDELHLEFPFAGNWMLRDILQREGHQIGRKHVATLMKRMGIKALYKKPNTSRHHPAHAIYPYLLRNLEISRANHVWAADITYVPMKRGFVYLFAAMDWASRRALSWRLSNTLTTDFCTEALQEAIDRYGTPEIFNTDQGS